MGALPPIFIEFIGSTAGFTAASGIVKSELTALQAKNADIMSRFQTITKAAFLGSAVAATAFGVHTVNMAADFETAMTRVRTGAGESAGNMKLVGDGVLEMAGQVGKSTEELTSSLYTVESAGYHGKAALDVLRIAAMGAKVGAAELPPVADALTTAMNAYKMSSDDASKAMNTLIATEANGKTNLEALAGSMSKILPVSAAAKVGFQEVMGAMATMTAQGTSADVAATYLRQTIGSLSNPSGKAAQEMRGLGLDATKVAQDLGSHGLAYTLNELTDAIQNRMGPAGTVLVDTLRKASANTDEYEKALANLKPAEQTQIGALATMVGGTKSMMGALQLTGPHMADFQANVQKIGEQVQAGGHHVEGWAEVQGTFNQRMAEAKAHFEAAEIAIGQKLMPIASKMFDLFNKGTTWLGQHHNVMIALGGALGGILTAGLVAATAAAIEFTIALLGNPLTWIIIGVMALGAAIALLIIHWKEVWKWITEVSKGIVDWVVGAWRTVADATSDTWNNYVVQPIKAAWNAIVSFFSSAWHAVADPIVSGWNWIAGVTVSVWNSISGFFSKWWPLLLVVFATPIAILVGLWNHTHKWFADTASTVWGYISGFFSSIWDGITAVAKGAWQLFTDLVIEPNIWLGGKIAELWNALCDWLSSLWDSIANVASGAWAGIRDFILKPLLRIWDDISGVFGRVAGFIGGAFDDVLNFLGGIWDSFASVGEGIVNGIIKGLKNGWHWLTDQVKHLAGAALDAAKELLGINSPSRVFAEEVGQWIPKGVAAGIEKHAPSMLGAVGRLSAAATGAFNIGGLEPAFAGGPGSIGGGHSVRHETHVHVTVNGTVTADRDLADTIKRVMLQDGARNRQTYQSFRR